MKVEDQGVPVEGLRLTISIGNSPDKRIAAVTNGDGIALFGTVDSGDYLLNTDIDTGVAFGVVVKVTGNGPRGATVPITWPQIPPVAVRSLKGTLRGPDYLPGRQRELSLELHDGVSGKLIKALRTNAHGQFDSEITKPGRYFLRLKPSGLLDWGRNEITGLIAVTVSPNTSQDQMDVDLLWSSCGLSYADSGKCQQNESPLARLPDQVVDTSGGAIAGAKISLLDDSDTLVEEFQSDNTGKIAPTHALAAGTYQLVVSRAGFTPYRRTIRIDPNGDPLTPSNLTVNLGFGGMCSTGSSQ